MEQSTAVRRLVKSPPELWAELSSEDSLGRRLAEFGDIRITRVDPETTVAWEGDRVSGTVELIPTGWGTKVMLTATPGDEDPAPAALCARAERRRFFAWRLGEQQDAAGAALTTARTAAILSDVLDDLSSAHHRPFSRD